MRVISLKVECERERDYWRASRVSRSAVYRGEPTIRICLDAYITPEEHDRIIAFINGDGAAIPPAKAPALHAGPIDAEFVEDDVPRLPAGPRAGKAGRG